MMVNCDALLFLVKFYVVTDSSFDAFVAFRFVAFFLNPRFKLCKLSAYHRTRTLLHCRV